MDKAAAVERVKRYADAVSQVLPVKKVILYGSYAKGSAGEHSDIDVGVILDRVDEDYLTIASRLFSLRRAIDARIEPVLIEEEDDPSGFSQMVSKTGMVIFSSDRS